MVLLLRPLEHHLEHKLYKLKSITQAPEIITGQDYDEMVDIFSYGIVLCEIITRRKISRELQRKPEEAFALNPKELDKLIPPDCPEALKQLAIKCADYTPENRPSFLQILDGLADIEKEVREGISLHSHCFMAALSQNIVHRHDEHHWRHTAGSGTLDAQTRNLGSIPVRSQRPLFLCSLAHSCFYVNEAQRDSTSTKTKRGMLVPP